MDNFTKTQIINNEIINEEVQILDMKQYLKLEEELKIVKKQLKVYKILTFSCLFIFLILILSQIKLPHKIDDRYKYVIEYKNNGDYEQMRSFLEVIKYSEQDTNILNKYYYSADSLEKEELIKNYKIYIANEEYSKVFDIYKDSTFKFYDELNYYYNLAKQGNRRLDSLYHIELAEKKKEFDKMSKLLRKKYDDIDEITWYRDKNSPEYVNENSFFLYMGQREGELPWLKLKIQYASDDWLFIESYTIKTDNNTYEITPNDEEVKRDNNSKNLWEVYEKTINIQDTIMLHDIINSKNVKIRCIGDKYSDRIITESEKKALQNMLQAHEYLGGIYIN